MRRYRGRTSIHIEFSQKFLPYTNKLTHNEVPGKTVGDVLEALFNRFPQLLVFLSERKGIEATKTTIQLNGEYIFDIDALQIEVGDDDVILFGRDVPEGQGGVGKIIAGVVLIVAAIAAGPIGWGLIGANLAIGIGAVGASLAIGGAAELIMGQPKLPTMDGSNSPTYSFTGIRNTTTPGTPIPIVYGRHRVGGHILNAYTDVIAQTNNYLYIQAGIPDQRTQSAYHEAGHAVVAHYLFPGIVEEVFIHEGLRRLADALDDNDSQRATAGNKMLRGGMRLKQTARIRIVESGLIAYAGFAAHCTQLSLAGHDLNQHEGLLHFGAKQDFSAFAETLNRAGVPDEIRKTAIVDIQYQLRDWFDGPLWDSVERVANALIERSRLSGEELVELARYPAAQDRY